MWCPFRAPRFCGDQLCPQLIGKPRYDLVLHIKEVGQGLVEPLGPEMRAGLGVDELDIDAQPIAERWTLPSNIYRTFSSRPICFTSEGLPL